MGLIKTAVSDIGVSASVNNPALFPSVTSIQLSGPQLMAKAADGLSEEAYERVSKEIRITFSFCFEHVYSEDYDISIPGTGIAHGGHDERKQHLLDETGSVSEKFGNVSRELFEDAANTKLVQSKRRSFFNSAFIWARANELQELKLLTEAYTQYWRLLDLVYKKSQLNKVQVAKLLNKYSMRPTESNVFALKVLHKMNMLKDSSSNIESLALLDSLRHPHAHQASDRTDYYMEEETHLEAEMHNIFIADITKLFIIWEIGLKGYYLRPRANIYELAKKDN